MLSGSVSEARPSPQGLHSKMGFKSIWTFNIYQPISLCWKKKERQRCHRLAFRLRVWIKVLVAPWPCKCLNKGDLKLRFTPWLKRTCKLQKQNQGKLSNAGSKTNIQERYFSPSLASISISNLKCSNYNMRIALRYLIPSSLLATWPDAAPYAGKALHSCLSPSSRFLARALLF